MVVSSLPISTGTHLNTTKKPFDLLDEGLVLSSGGVVGEERFELSASCSQSRRANRAAPLPDTSQYTITDLTPQGASLTISTEVRNGSGPPY